MKYLEPRRMTYCAYKTARDLGCEELQDNKKETESAQFHLYSDKKHFVASWWNFALV